MNTNVFGIERPAGLLDILVVVTESWKLLVFVPILGGLLAFGICQLQTRGYQSKATLLMIQTDDGLIIPRDVVLRALMTVPRAPDVDDILANISLGKPVQQVGRVSRVPIALSIPDSKMAPALLHAILSGYQVQFLDAVRDQYRSAYQHEIDIATKEIANRTKTLEIVEKMQERDSSNVSAISNSGVGTIATALVSLTSGLEERERKREDFIRQLSLLPKSIVAEAPTAATLVRGANTSATVLFAMIGAEILALVFVFLRDLARRQAALPGGAEKVARIRRALGLRPIASADQAGHH